MPARRARARRARRAPAAPRRPRARPARRGPSRRRRRRGRGRAAARAWPVTAVLPTRFPVPITAIERQLERLEARRVEAEVGADVRQPGRERARRPAEALGRAEHGLVREVDDDLGVRRSPRRAARRSRRRRAASRCRRPGSRRRTRTAARRARRARPARSARRRSARPRAHRSRVTSRSIRPVYFSYSPVSRSNWMIRSCPWNG